jgi:integrase
LIERKFGDMPLAALADARSRDVFLTWRDSLPGKSRRQSDYAITVLAWGLTRHKIKVNPFVNPGRVYRGSRRDKIWTYEDEAAFLELAPARMHLPFLLAIWTAQRQGDLLRLTWTGYDGKWIRLRQSKTGTRVAVPVGGPLKIALDATAKVKKSPSILVNSDNQPWTAHGFRSSWRKACAKAGVVGLTFQGLR